MNTYIFWIFQYQLECDRLIKNLEQIGQMNTDETATNIWQSKTNSNQWDRCTKEETATNEAETCPWNLNKSDRHIKIKIQQMRQIRPIHKSWNKLVWQTDRHIEIQLQMAHTQRHETARDGADTEMWNWSKWDLLRDWKEQTVVFDFFFHLLSNLLEIKQYSTKTFLLVFF